MKAPRFTPIMLLIWMLLWAQTSVAATKEDVLQLAEDAGRWIAMQSIEQESGVAWSSNALSPETVTFDLASGVSGDVVFFVALYRATGKPEYLAYAERGADYLVSVLQQPDKFDGNERRASLYSGVSGIGVALMHVRAVSDKQKYATAIGSLVALLQKWGIRNNDSLHWSGKFNDLVYGDAGTVLFLASLAATGENEQAGVMARQGARFLLSLAKTEGTGSYWLFRRDKEFNLPNFSHGTAGVIYVLATVAKLTGDEDLKLGALAGFEYLASIVEIESDQIRFPYGWGSDSWDGLYEFGWAHGLAGVALTLQRLQQSDIASDRASLYMEKTLTTLSNINLPNTPSSPFAEPSTPLDFRFGRAGVLSLASHWAVQNPNDSAIVSLRDSIWMQIEKEAIREGDTAHWQVDAPEFMGGGRAAYTGLFHGASGIGLALLQMHAGLVGHPPYSYLPDDPFEH